MTDDERERIELGEQQRAGGKDAAGRVSHRHRVRRAQTAESGALAVGRAPEQGAVDTAVVGGVVMDIAIAVLSKRGLGEQAAQAGGGLHLAETDRRRRLSGGVRQGQHDLRDPARFGCQARAFLKEILDIPERDILGGSRGSGKKNKANQSLKFHSLFHKANMRIIS